VLNAHSDIFESAVIGAPHPDYGARPVAFLVAQRPQAHRSNDAIRDAQIDPPPLSHEELSMWCKDRLSNYKIPDVFVWVSDLPRGQLGKLQRASLRQSAAQELSHTLHMNRKREDL
jgi:acyl-coenzyme A synthetase/AMP-(fatty) acid ligase